MSMASAEQPGVSVGVHEAKTHLSKLLNRVEAGEEVTIMRDHMPVAKIVPIRSGKRQLGLDEGRFEVPDDFDAPLPDEVLAAFER